jgi:pimeloyl-ACP methyl ester carboxylesterase
MTKSKPNTTKAQSETGYARLNGLEMYYEIHGTGEPLLLLHGQFASIGMFSRILPPLAQSRRVVAVEQQGHGHTADVDRPLRFEQMADDTSALLRHIGIEQSDVYGYSTGGWVALHLALRHSSMVRKLAVSSTAYDIDGYLPQIKAGLLNPRPDAFPKIIRESYERVAPKPDQWLTLVAKAGEQAAAERGLTAAQLSSISAPALVIAAERDVIRPEHSRELARLLRTELVILPDSDHSSYVSDNTAALLSNLRTFFNLPEARLHA